MARRGRPPITVTIADGVRAELDPAHLEEMIDTNVKGTIYALRACLPHLLESDRADFVTVASEAGRRGLPFEAVYCASKFAQVGFTRAMDHELRPQGVRCTNICPGGVATEFAMGRGRTADMPELEGMMSAENVAEAVMFAITRPRNHRILEMAFRTRVSLGIGLRTRSVVRGSRGCPGSAGRATRLVTRVSGERVVTAEGHQRCSRDATGDSDDRRR